MKMNLKYMTAVLSIVVAGTLSSCSNKSQQQMPAANFETMKVTTKDVTMTTKYSATIRGRQDIDILPQVSGTLTKLHPKSLSASEVLKFSTMEVPVMIPW